MAHTYAPGDEPVPGSGYRLVEFLGRGGFGQVWKASAPGGAEAALKFIQLGGKEGRKEFRALQLVKRIRHPNLVPIFAFWLKGEDGSILDDSLAGQQDLPLAETAPAPMSETMVVAPPVQSAQASELIMAMGLGDKSLFDRLEECRREGLQGIPHEELLGYMEKAAEAIDFLNRPIHNLGAGPVAIQHCDIKPHNLMIVGGATQVCDFGLARMMGADRTTTAAATLAYAAPECLVEGKPSDSTDQYALAVTYYELRTGRLPYRDETLMGVMEAKRQGNLDFSTLSDAETKILRRATSQHPADRYPSTSEMVQELRRASTGELRVVAPRAGRSRRGAMALAVLLIAAAFGTWYMLRERTPALVDPAAEALLRAEAHLRQGEYAPAIEDYTEVIELRADDAAARFARGRCHLKLGQYGEAIADFEQAVELDPQNTLGYRDRPEIGEAYLERGTRFLKQGDYGQATADLDRARQHNPQDARVYSRLAAAHYAQKQWPEVIEDLKVSLRLDPNDIDYVNRGVAYRALNKPNEAIIDFAKAIELNPRNAAAYKQRGDLRIDQERFDDAIIDLNEAIDLYGKDSNAKSKLVGAYILRGNAHMQAGHLDQASGDFKEAMSRGAPEDLASSHKSLAALAAAYAADGKFPAAVEWIKKAIDAAPDDATKKRYVSDRAKYEAGKSA